MYIRYSNIKRPSEDLSDGYSIFSYPPRYIFDIRISNVHLTSCQMDMRHSNIKRPSDQLPDGYSIFEYKRPSEDLTDGSSILGCQTSI